MDLQPLLEKITADLIKKKLTLATAESCTGGLLAHYLTSISGSSEYFIQGIVSYSNHAKEDLLKVKHTTLDKYGAVSEQTAHEMAKGVQTQAQVDIGISTTGIAGPTGGTSEKPVGLVFIGIATQAGVQVHRFQFTGNRLENKQYTCYEALKMIQIYLQQI